MTYFSNATRVAEVWSARRAKPVFEPLTVTAARRILDDTFAEPEDVEDYRRDVRAWLAGTSEKLTDDDVYADADGNGAVLCALALVWADDTYTREGYRTFEFVADVTRQARTRKGAGAGAIRGLLNCLRADALRNARAIAEAAPFTDEPDPEPEFIKVVEFLQTLAKNGLKQPKVRLTDGTIGDDGHANVVALSIAGPNSRNPGAINVTDGKPFGQNKFYGIIKTDGQPNAPLASHGQVLAVLREFVANPETALVKYGRVTSTCSICGRELSNKVSIERGIGPICAEKGGL